MFLLMAELKGENYLEIQGVRISPAKIIFKQRSHGRKLTEKITIQNVGTSKAVIRIPLLKHPNCELECIPRGQDLYPGLRIVKSFKLTYDKDSPKQYELPMFFNEEKLTYTIKLISPTSLLIVTPAALDFGMVSAGTTRTIHDVEVRNVGDKAAAFYVDTTACSRCVLVAPTKGYLQGNTAQNLTVKLISFQATDIKTTFLIRYGSKSAPVSVKADIIYSALQAIHPTATRFFTLLSFAHTYYGLQVETNLLVRNYSGVTGMFIIEGQIYNKSVPLEEYAKLVHDSKNFESEPVQGVFEANQTRIFQFRYVPKRCKMKKSKEACTFHLCTILIRRFRCDYLKSYTEYKASSIKETVGADSCCLSTLSYSMSQEMAVESVNEASDFYEQQIERDFLRVHLYGTAEEPTVRITPSEVMIRHCDLNTCEISYVELKNMSSKLPIIVRCVQSPYIKVGKKKILIEPLKSVRVCIRVCPKRLGIIAGAVIYDLMYYDLPRNDEGLKVIGSISIPIKIRPLNVTLYPSPEINTGLTPNYIREVGKHCQDIRFNTPLNNCKLIVVGDYGMIDESCNYLVALPNDTQQSLRPYRNHIPCLTIFTRKAKYVQPIDSRYELSEIEMSLKAEVKKYYNRYLQTRYLNRKLDDGVVDYSITLEQKFLCEDLPLVKCLPIVPKIVKKTRRFMPLTPQQMINVVVSPAMIHSGPVATDYDYMFHVTVTNKNDIAIRIFLSSEDPDVLYPMQGTYIIKRNTESDLSMVYKTTNTGYFTSNMLLIVNATMMLTIPIFVEVVPRTLHLSPKFVNLTENKRSQYIVMTNKLNVEVSFLWMVVDQNFLIEPSMGLVKIGRSIICVVRYIDNIEGPDNTTAQLHCCKSYAQRLNISSCFNYKPLQLTTQEINFGKIPLNEKTYQNTIIRNLQNFPVTFTTENELSAVEVYPPSGCIPGLSQYVLHIYVLFENCVQFKDELIIKTVKSDLKLPIIGKVVYPDVEIIPKFLNIDKIPASTTNFVSFTLKNKSDVATSVKFDMNEYPDFRISTSPLEWEESEYLTELIMDSKTSRTLCLHFAPTGVSSSLFYLPIILNNIIGPPILTDHISTKVDYYLNQMYDNCRPCNKPVELPCTKVKFLATAPKILISRSVINFSTYAARRSHFFKLTITSCEKEQICLLIGLKDLKHPIYVDCPDMKQVSSGLAKRLEPGQIITMKISFCPGQLEFGTYVCLLPVYLKSIESAQVHKVIIVNAVYHQPSITTCQTTKTEHSLWQDPSFMYYADNYPPVNKNIYTEKQLKFYKHLPNCQILCKAIDINVVFVALSETKRIINGDEYDITVKYTSFPSSEEVYNGKLEISCSCGAYFLWTTFGCFEKSILTTYDYCHLHLFEPMCADIEGETGSYISKSSTVKFVHEQIEMDFDKCYPLFPNDRAEFLEMCIAAADTWLCKEVFYDCWGFAISYSTRIPNYDRPDEEYVKKQTQLCCIPFVHILSNLVGPEIIDMLGIRYDIEDPVDRIRYLHAIYAKSINFLVKHGASFTYMQPEFLFCFKDFMIYKKKIFVKPEPPYTLTVGIDNRTDFLRLSKQAWLDVVLQSYKVLYLNRLTSKENVEVLNGISPPFANFFESDYYNEPRLNMSDAEALLLNWLDYHFESGRSSVWSDGHLIQCREVSFFSDSLKDSLVFAVVTAVYCPYLVPYMQDMYRFPDSLEEVYHNASILIKCWEMVNCSFTITQEQIMSSNMVLMIMVSAYLFQILPYMYPTEELVFNAGLSRRVNKRITLTNTNSFPIAYKPKLILNNGCFEVRGFLFILSPHKSKQITIDYYAKLAVLSDVALILSGEVAGYKYATNKCLKLIGNPNLQYAVTTIKYPLPLYKLIEVDIVIQSPYNNKKAAQYNVQQTYVNVSEPFELANVLYHYESDRIGCGRFIFTNKDYVFNENGQCTIHAIISTLHNVNTTTWVYFRNTALGDFAIKLICAISAPPEREVLSVILSKQKLLSKSDKLILRIPFKNQLFFETMQSLMVKLTEGQERELWERIIDTPMGVNLLARLLEHSQRMLPFHCTPAEYNVSIDNAEEDPVDVTLPESIEFQDECSPGFIEVPMLLKNPGTQPRDFCFKLSCPSTNRMRCYYVEFIYNL